MKIIEIITDKYKLRIAPTVYYDLLADVVEAEEEKEPKTGHWIDTGSGQECSECHEIQYGYDSFRRFCAYCGARMEVVGNPDRLESKESDAENLCDSCKTKGCIFQSGIVRSHCDFYKGESEG